MTSIAELRRLEAEAKNVKRYSPSVERTLSGMTERPEGDYVRYADYLAILDALPELLKALEEARERNAVMENALTNISMMHDGNPPIPLADIPEIDYARRVISTMRLHARDALPPHGGVDVG